MSGHVSECLWGCGGRLCVGVGGWACVCACVYACMRVCMRVCVCGCVGVGVRESVCVCIDVYFTNGSTMFRKQHQLISSIIHPHLTLNIT